MKALIMFIAGLMATTANADGFVCENLEQNVRIKVYNQTSAELGTRSSAVMIISDPSVSHGRKTIAKFEAADGLLTNSGSRYVAEVDLRFSNSGRSGENLASTKLGEVDQIILDVDFLYSQPVEDEAEVSGVMYLKMREGRTRAVSLACERYLKN